MFNLESEDGMFGIGSTELLILLIVGGLVALPVLAVVALFIILNSRQND